MLSRRLKKVAIATAIVLGVLAIGVMVTVRSLLVASLPRMNGTVAIHGLGSAVEIARDKRGIPIIQGERFGDVALALGYLHAQERFFQMDLLRRRAAGELAEVVGPAALDSDKKMRPLGLRRMSSEVLALLPEQHRHWLEMYANGVNAGLADLDARPPEYWLLRTKPKPWRAEDSMLVTYAMFDALSTGRWVEESVDVMRAALPEELVTFLTPETGRFDSPIIGGNEYTPLPIPGPDVVDLRKVKPRDNEAHAAATFALRAVPGSNNWAVSARKTTDGRAIVAGDPHLGLRVPGTWYRAQFQWHDDSGTERFAAGVTLPGVPAIVLGSNGAVAWAMTNVTGDFQDSIIVEPDPDDPKRYLTPDGSEPFGHTEKDIAIHGAPPHRLVLKTTRWGPISGTDALKRPTVLKWIATEPGKGNLALLDLLEAQNADEALDVARHWQGPPQNVMVADTTGRIGFAVSGWLPNRQGYDGLSPTSWAVSGVGWDGSLDDSLRPMMIDPADGVLFTANARTVGLVQARHLGRHWPVGTRAGRIAELLRTDDLINERDMLEIQLDTRVEMMDAYRLIILEVVDEDEKDNRLRAARASAEAWNGRAEVDSRGFTVIWAFRSKLVMDLLKKLTAACHELDKTFAYRWLQVDEPILRILDEQPAHLVPAPYSSWREYLRAMFTDAVREMKPGGDRWGEHNRARIQHPLSQAVPMLGWLLDMRHDELPGHTQAVRVLTPSFGASMRMVVSPGHEEDGFLHMPCGQSGHPLSQHYADEHRSWVQGDPEPLLAGAAVSTVRLVPRVESKTP